MAALLREATELVQEEGLADSRIALGCEATRRAVPEGVQSLTESSKLVRPPNRLDRARGQGVSSIRRLPLYKKFRVRIRERPRGRDARAAAGSQHVPFPSPAPPRASRVRRRLR